MAQAAPVYISNGQGGYDVLLKPPAAAAPAAIQTVGTPGRNAQAVVSAPIEAPNMGGNAPPTAALAQALATAVAPSMTEAHPSKDEPAPNQPAAAAAAPQPDAGFVDGVVSGAAPGGIMAGLGDYMSAFGGGVRAIDPRASGIMQAAQGFSGAVDARTARSDRKRAEQAAADERQYQHSQDTLANKRADRTFGMTEEHYQAEDTRASRKDARDAASQQLSDIAAAAGIEHTQAETKKIASDYTAGGFTFDQQQKIENDVMERAKLRKGQAGPFASISAPTAAEIAAEKAKQDADRAELMKLYKPGQGEQPPAGGSSAAPKTSGGGGAVSGAGTQQAPINWGGSGPASVEEAKAHLDAALKASGKSQIFYVNPSDERVLPYP